MSGYGRSIEKGDEHYTPAWVFECLNVKFDLDVCSPQGGRNISTQYFTETDDGLSQDWHGNVWMNPPYSTPTPWVDKFLEHGKGIALLPITRGKWWDRMWQASDAVVPCEYNFKFERPDGTQRVIMFRTMYFAIGEENAKALQKVSPNRVR